ncbi:hypothetical protein GUITHDRAFT_147358 [Guillardia theta CCMP2712]|uniref:Peptidase A2 domain-containing protein n=1 Tax=Guillardia theta (strain CCMP2712) TaxID=905079 RepID=L1IEH4_GUITC|nr:hypothetical protein GUITHDRAFT_147358 [Guillardia theta CCMP2712]EKX34235.1 hypothetical protein GUITHDRAFT_147358 [Guillardia theta CCMP2712]|eukprot:XP_005821215.1 hypothetical protein GUITHDRAFT_147358 [Guillardia theta CCMP2712]
MDRQEKMKWEALNTGRMSWEDFTKLMKKMRLSPDFPIRLMTLLRDMKQGPKESISNFIQRYSAMTNLLVAFSPDKVSFGNFVIEQIFVNNVSSRTVQSRLIELLSPLREAARAYAQEAGQEYMVPLASSCYLPTLFEKAVSAAPCKVDTAATVALGAARSGSAVATQKQMSCMAVLDGRKETLRALLDTGADETFIDEQLGSDEPIAVEMVNGVREISNGSVTLEFALGPRFQSQARFYIICLQHTDVILSSIDEWKADARFRKGRVQLPVEVRPDHADKSRRLCLSTEELMHDIRAGEVVEFYQINLAQKTTTDGNDQTQLYTKQLLKDYQDVVVDEIPVGAKSNREF